MWFFRFCFCVNLESQYSHLFSFLTFMDCSNMHFQNPITSKNGVTRVTFKWCFSFKNWHNIFFSSVLVRTSIIAITLIFHLHEQMQYGSPDYVYKKIYHHNYHIWMAFFLHELKQCIFKILMLWKFSVTSITFEWFFTFIDWKNCEF